MTEHEIIQITETFCYHLSTSSLKSCKCDLKGSLLLWKYIHASVYVRNLVLQ